LQLLQDFVGFLGRRLTCFLLYGCNTDRIATAIFLIVLPIGFLINIFVIMPVWYPAFGEAWVIRVLCFMLLAFNVYINWYKMVTVGPSGMATVLPNVVKAGFRYVYCHSCHTNAPPRAYHCPVCDKCCFRRDHHCSFGAVCVGHFNQRYFVAAVVNLLLLCIPLFRYTWDFVWIRIEGGFSMGRCWQILLPHLALMTSFFYLNVFNFVVSVFLYCLLAFVRSISCFCTNIFEFISFVTGSYCGLHAYQMGFLDNLNQCLGSRWPLIFISPFIPSPLPSDGMTFVTREIKEYNDPKYL
uniref:Palmitoyltransferase n=1 Tax=Angiostrongylus costaricensis TaxID=334426 RepID=A0A0R3PFL3_ANGCS